MQLNSPKFGTYTIDRFLGNNEQEQKLRDTAATLDSTLASRGLGPVLSKSGRIQMDVTVGEQGSGRIEITADNSKTQHQVAEHIVREGAKRVGNPAPGHAESYTLNGVIINLWNQAFRNLSSLLKAQLEKDSSNLCHGTADGDA